MNENEEILKEDWPIEELVEDLKPTRPLRSPFLRGMLWLAFHLLTLSIIMYGISPYSLDFLQKFRIPHFTLNFIVYLGALAFSTLLSFHFIIPGKAKESWFFIPFACYLILCWFSFSQVLVPFNTTMVQEIRPFCELEIFFLSFIPGFHLLYLLRKGLIRYKSKTVLLGLLGSSLIPAFVMQFACIIEPHHSLLFHITPMAVFVGTGFLIFKIIKRKDNT